MMRSPRGLSPEEKALWRRVAGTVVPIHPPRNGEGNHAQHDGGGEPPSAPSPKPPAKPAIPLHRVTRGPLPRAGEDIQRHGLDSSWERRLKGARIEPDFTLDLHGCSLDAAHARLDRGLAQARALGARLVLVVTGRPRPADAADRGTRRGAIRAKILDWLAAGPHAGDIAAIRGAHRRHGGDGALYIVLRRAR